MTAAVTESRFSEELRRATGRSHGDAQHSPFMSALFAGELEFRRYANLVAQYFHIYGALEERAVALGGTTAEAFIEPSLTRIPAIEADLRHFLGGGWRSEIRPLVTTLEYVGRILDARPEQFVAHHYVRYMGDLSGGQIIGRLIARVYEFPDGLGTAAYRFDGIDSPKRFKDDYRARLDALPWGDAERQQVIDEAIAAFACNRALFADLESSLRD